MLSLLLAAALVTTQDTLPRTSGRPPADTVATDSATALGAIRIRAAAGVRRTWSAPLSRSALRTATPLRETPQSVSVLTAPAIVDLGLTTMTRAVEYLPGITMGQGEGHRDAPTIRGQSTTADFFVDGVRDDAQYLRDNYNVEQLEALKGANALAFGRGGGGGVINRVTKQATWQPVRSARFETGAFGTRRATLDLGAPATRSFAVRLNAMHEVADSYRDAVGRERFGIAPTATAFLGEASVRVGAEVYRDRRTTDRGVPSANGTPSGAPIDRFFGDPSLSDSRVDVTSGFVIAERDFGSSVNVRTHLRATGYDKFYQNVYAASAANTTAGTVDLGAYNSATDRLNLLSQTDVTWTTATKGVRSALLVGAELSRQRSDNLRLTGLFDGTEARRTVPFEDPRTRGDVTFVARTSDADNRSTARVAALYAQEQLRLGERWQLIGGARVDRVTVTLDDRRDGARYERTDDIVSPRLGVVYLPAADWSVYSSYGTTALPSAGDQFAGLDAQTSSLAPERFTNREIGVKWGRDDRLEASFALYRVERSNSAAPDPADVTRLVQTGRQRTDGVELGVSGAVRDGWRVLGAVAVQDAQIVQTTGSAAAGAVSPLVPRTTASLWNAIDVTRRLTVGAGVVHQAQRYTTLDNSVTLPAFTRVDASIDWRPAQVPGASNSGTAAVLSSVGVQLRVENLFDARYYPTSHGNNNIMPGAPRNLQVALVFDRW